MQENVSTKIQDNTDTVKSIFKNSCDIVYSDIQSESGTNAIIIYIDGIIEKEIINRYVIEPFILGFKNNDFKKSIHLSGTSEVKTIEKVINGILDCQAAMFIDGTDKAFILDTKGWDKRAIEEPESEISIRGPKEGFVESLRINTALIRRKIKNPNLIFENMKIGTQTRTDVTIAYIDDIVNKAILEDLKNKLNVIDLDGVLESGYIEQYIEDKYYSLFSTVGNSQKPDIVAAKLLEGRIAIICDGTPHVLTVPYLFVENVQTSEDYYIRPVMASLLRILRILSLLIGILLPGVYVALQTYHQEMIPTNLLIRMVAAKEGLPFPALAEAFFMISMFEFLKESGTRLPRQIGSAVSIVGALVIGESAVNAGLVSGTMVIVVAITAICSFIVSSLAEPIVIYRFIFIFLGGFMGLYGVTCGIFMMTAHMASLKSFGIPYLFPAAPFDKEGMKDYTIRFPLFKMKMRPNFIAKNNIKRRRK